MSTFSNTVLDASLNVVRNQCDAIHLCSGFPSTYAQATDTLSLGVKTSPVIAEPANIITGGRRVEVSDFSDGVVTDSGTGTHIALVDTNAEIVLAVRTLTTPVNVSSPNSWQANQFRMQIPIALS